MENSDKTKIQLDTSLYMCHLIRCILNDTVPVSPPENVSLRKLYTLARHNSIEGIVFYGVCKTELARDTESIKKWETTLNKIIYQLACFDAEREQILCEMKKTGLSYITLKGIKLSRFYPLPGMRSMADNDILFGYPDSAEKTVEDASEALKNIMLDLGFELDSSTDKDDIYHKAPFFNFEMHKALAAKSDQFYSYYSDPWMRAIPQGNGEYVFSPEDDYIYNIVHMYKHFISAGCGIRHIIDLYVIHKNIGDALDHDYIRKELTTLGIDAFHSTIVNFMNDIFNGGNTISDESKELLLFFTGCGTFGNMEGVIHNRIKKASESSGGDDKKTKFFYIFRRIFPSREDCRKNYPFFYKHPYFMPALYVFRIGRGMIFKSKKIFGEFANIIKK